MASVKDIVDGDKQDISWIELLDSDGKKWKYHKVGVAAAGAVVHIHKHADGRMEAMPDGKGGVILQQNDPGLPKEINVRFAPTPGPSVGLVATGVVTTWGSGDGTVFAYEFRSKAT